MNAILTQHNLLILCYLIAAHLLTDAICHLKIGKKKKRILDSRLIQAGVAGIIAYIFVHSWHLIWLPLVIFTSRLILDWDKCKKETILIFMLNLLGHTVIITTCWLLIITDNIIQFLEIPYRLLSNTTLWIISLSYILITFPVGRLIGRITEPWRKELGNKTKFQGLAKAGMWIGLLERILILTFVLLSHYEAIGFLIAAKSIFRFEEIKNSDDRKEVEYILIGTMISFVISIFFGIMVKWILKH